MSKGESLQQNETPNTRAYRPRKWMRAFLTVLADQGVVRVACEAAKIDRSVVYKARETDAVFDQAWQDAIEHAADLLEEEARRRAFVGTMKPVFQGGKEVGRVREYSDTLMVFLLKGARPDKYRENVKAEITGSVGLHVVAAPLKMDEETWNSKAEQLTEQRPRSLKRA